MKKILNPIYIISALLMLSLFAILDGCKTTQAIADKSGAQLWAENCNRCHNAPTPTIYSDSQWEAVGEHMRYKANLTDQEVKKIVEFLKSAN